LDKLILLIAAVISTSLTYAESKPISTNVCEITKNPNQFDNKFVQIRATLTGNFEISAIRDPEHDDCGSLWFTFPGSGPEASVSISTLTPTQPRPIVRLNQNSQFRHFQKMSQAKMYAREQNSLCMDCTRYNVSATMTGLVEYAGPSLGFGHMNGFPVQFVLQSIQESSVKDLASQYGTNYSTSPIRFPTGYISGRLLGPEGQAISDGDLNIYSATDPEAHIENDSATTDSKGRFQFAVPPGKYIIGFNTFWHPSPNFPFSPTYFPGTQQRSNAGVIEIADREHKHGLIIHLPKPLKPRDFPVLVLWTNKNPVADANVWLSEKTDPTSVIGISVSHTNKDGRFDLIGFEGIDYIVHADKYGGLTQVSCAKNLLFHAMDAIPSRITLSLSIRDFNICKDIDFEVPEEDKTVK